jgi:hypothetical protein
MADEEGDGPEPEGTRGRGVRDEPDDRPAVERRLPERPEGAAPGGALRDVNALGLRDEEAQDGGGEARPTGAEEGGAPAEVALEEAADEKAERRADRHGDVEDGKPAPLLLEGRDVVDDRRRDGDVARLADADHDARPLEVVKPAREPRADGRQAPDGDPHGQQVLARSAVAEGAEHGAGQEVADEEDRREEAKLAVVDVKLALDALEHGREHEPIDVVQ